jgi:hypothetical protein
MQEGPLLMNQAEGDRLVALKKIKKKLITQREAAEELGAQSAAGETADKTSPCTKGVATVIAPIACWEKTNSSSGSFQDTCTEAIDRLSPNAQSVAGPH